MCSFRTLNHTELQSEGQDSGKMECKRAKGLIVPKVNLFTVRFVKMVGPRDLIERVSPAPIGWKGGGWWFLLENLLETHQTPGRNDIDNQMVPIPA